LSFESSDVDELKNSIVKKIVSIGAAAEGLAESHRPEGAKQ